MMTMSAERLAYMEFVMGLWFHTRELAGKPTVREASETLREQVPRRTRAGIIDTLVRTKQVEPPDPFKMAEAIFESQNLIRGLIPDNPTDREAERAHGEKVADLARTTSVCFD